MADPVTTNPALYRVVLENERVRVLEYLDQPGDCTLAHAHPDSVMSPSQGSPAACRRSARRWRSSYRRSAPVGLTRRNTPGPTSATRRRTACSSS
jgi:hypothetical protein